MYMYGGRQEVFINVRGDDKEVSINVRGDEEVFNKCTFKLHPKYKNAKAFSEENYRVRESAVWDFGTKLNKYYCTPHHRHRCKCSVCQLALLCCCPLKPTALGADNPEDSHHSLGPTSSSLGVGQTPSAPAHRRDSFR